MKRIYETLLDFLKNRESVVLASLIANSGSTPREAGAKMIIRRNRQIVGTIGGGRIEAEVQKIAADIFESKKSCIQNYNLSADGIASIGMICGGEASVYIQYVDADDRNNWDLYNKVTQSCRENKKAWLITVISEKGNEYVQYVFGKNEVPADDNEEAVFNKIITYMNNKRIVRTEDNVKYIIEPIFGQSKAYLFGGGHVGYELVPVLSRLGFYTVVIDDREEFSNKDRFPDANETITADFIESFSKLPINENSFIVIVTRGHIHDYSVLKKALATDALYIGMIGSGKKWAALKEKMFAEGFGEKDISRVHAPIGLKIKAETPEEIAISIAAEIIQEKAEYYKERLI